MNKKPSVKEPEKPKPVTKEMTFGAVLEKHPGAAMVMLKYGLHCIGCHVAYTETIEQGCMGHGMNSEEIKEMVDEINELIEHESDKKEYDEDSDSEDSEDEEEE